MYLKNNKIVFHMKQNKKRVSCETRFLLQTLFKPFKSL